MVATIFGFLTAIGKALWVRSPETPMRNPASAG